MRTFCFHITGVLPYCKYLLLTGWMAVCMLLRVAVAQEQVLDSLTAVKRFQQIEQTLDAGQVQLAIQQAGELAEESQGASLHLLTASCHRLAADAHLSLDQKTTALTCYLEALASYEKAKALQEAASLCMDIASFYQNSNALPNAIRYWEKSLAYQVNLKDSLAQIQSIQNLGNIYDRERQYEKAIPYYTDLLKFTQIRENEGRKLETLAKIAQFHTLLENYPDALRNYFQVLRGYEQQQDSVAIAAIQNNIGYVYTLSGEYENASIYLQKAYNLDVQLDSLSNGTVNALTNQGVVAQNQGENKQAITYLLQALKIRERLKNRRKEAHLRHLIGITYFQQKDYHNAAIYVRSAIDLAEQTKAGYLLRDAYKSYSDISKERNDFQTALQYNTLYVTLRDSLQFERRLKNLQRRQQQDLYEKTEQELQLLIADKEVKASDIRQLRLEKEQQAQEVLLLKQQQDLQSASLRQKELEQRAYEKNLALIRQMLQSEQQGKKIDSLEQEQRVQELELARNLLEQKQQKDSLAMLKQEKMMQDIELDQRRSRQWFLLGIGGLILISLIIIIIAYLQQQRANRQLSRQKKEIENSHQELARQKEKIEQSHQELGEAMEQLKTTQSQLVQSEKMASLGQLTAGIAHEINNPINFVSAGIRSMQRNLEELNLIWEKYEELTPGNAEELLEEIEELKEDLDYEEIKEELEELGKGIENGAERTTEIVKGLRTFSRLDEDDRKLADIHENLDSTLLMLRNQYKDRVEIIREYQEIPKILCYPGKLNQVFMNLLANGIQAIEGPGNITIRTAEKETHIEVQIEDSGSGMPQAVIDRIFEPFYTTKDVGAGTGLGLAISLGIIHDHNGNIRVESTEGEGSTFFIELPINLS